METVPFKLTLNVGINLAPLNLKLGAVKDRFQSFNPITENWVKSDATKGKFMDVKSDGTPFKGVTKK